MVQIAHGGAGGAIFAKRRGIRVAVPLELPAEGSVRHASGMALALDVDGAVESPATRMVVRMTCICACGECR